MVRRRRKEAMQECSDSAAKTLRLEVVEKERLGLVPAQDTYHANLGSSLVITVRTNEQFDRWLHLPPLLPDLPPLLPGQVRHQPGPG